MRARGFLPQTIIAPHLTSSSSSSFGASRPPTLSLLIKPSSRPLHPTINLQFHHHNRQLSSTPASKMSFSNTKVPDDKPADPYKATNLTNPDLKEKVQDLVSFMESCKFGMMTTRIESSGLLTSRCMALAAKVGPPCPNPPRCPFCLMEHGADRLPHHRKEAALTCFFTPTPNPARPTISSPNLRSTLPSSIPLASGPPSPAKPISSLTVKRSVNTTRRP